MKDKTLFVTGGNFGIGLATALLFAEQGVNIAIMGRRADKNAQAQKAIEAKGVKCIAITGDVAKEQDVADAIARVVNTFGGLHFGFNNAGVASMTKPLRKQTTEDFEREVGINLKGAWLCMKLELPLIEKSGGGCVVNTGSVYSKVGGLLMPIYAASKHGLVGLTKSAALEYARKGVRINMVCPGPIAETGILNKLEEIVPEGVKKLIDEVPMGRAGKPNEIAAGVLYLCSDAGAYITGQELYIDGGHTLGLPVTR